MPNHAWNSSIDISQLPPDQRGKVANTLNWLEQYFPEFNEMLYQIRQGQKEGKIHSKIKIIPDQYIQYDQDKDELSLNLKPNYYLGIDNKIYPESLNELLTHELQHAVQKTSPGYKAEKKAIEEAFSKRRSPRAALKAYLASKGVDQAGAIEYEAVILEGSYSSTLNPSILNDPQFKKLGKASLDAYNASSEKEYPREDNAMDRANILSRMVGKAPRGHYADSELLHDQMAKLGGTRLIYSDSPEVIRQRPPHTYPISPKTPLEPTITGHAGKRDGTIAQMQHDWNEKWNADTKNITGEEWRIIEEVKANLLSPEILKSITPQQKREVDKVIDNLKQNFNQTPENDALTDVNKQLLSDKKLDGIADKASQKGWRI